MQAQVEYFSCTVGASIMSGCVQSRSSPLKLRLHFKYKTQERAGAGFLTRREGIRSSSVIKRLPVRRTPPLVLHKSRPNRYAVGPPRLLKPAENAADSF